MQWYRYLQHPCVFLFSNAAGDECRIWFILPWFWQMHAKNPVTVPWINLMTSKPDETQLEKWLSLEMWALLEWKGWSKGLVISTWNSTMRPQNLNKLAQSHSGCPQKVNISENQAFWNGKLEGKAISRGVRGAWAVTKSASLSDLNRA